MSISYYKIGNIKLVLDIFESELIKRRMSAYACDKFDNPDAVITIEEKDVVTRDRSYTLIAAQDYRGYATNDDEYAIIDKLDSPDNLSAALYITKDCTKVRGYLKDIENLGGAPVDIRAFNMIGDAFKYIAIKHDGFVFHSSTIKYKDKGILFSAHSGTGKSTHTRLWLEYYPEEASMINDDSPLIKLVDGKPFVFGTPWSGKTDINDNVSAALSTIVFLRRAPISSITPLEFNEAFKLFIEQAFILPFAPSFMSFIATADKVLRQIKMTILNCNISKDAVDTIKGYLEENNENQ